MELSDNRSTHYPELYKMELELEAKEKLITELFEANERLKDKFAIDFLNFVNNNCHYKFDNWYMDGDIDNLRPITLKDLLIKCKEHINR